MDVDEAVKLLESFHDNRDGEGEEDNSQRPPADVETPQEGGGEDSGETTTTTSFEAEWQEAREDLEDGYGTLQLLERLLDEGRRTFRSHFGRSANTEVPPLPHRPRPPTCSAALHSLELAGELRRPCRSRSRALLVVPRQVAIDRRRVNVVFVSCHRHFLPVQSRSE